MLYIKATEQGAIRATSVDAIEGFAAYGGAIPEDFYDVIGQGKYLFLNGQLVEQEDWQLPVIGDLGSQYIFSSEELQASQGEAQQEIREDISAYYMEAPGTRYVRVVGNFTKYFKNEIMLATEVLFSDGRESKIVNLLANEQIRMPLPDGSTIGEYTYLLSRINSGESPNEVIREVLHFRASRDGGYRFA